MITNKFQYIPFTRETIDGKRMYLTPEGERLVSVTTILDATKSEESKAALKAWRDNVGHVRAQAITTEAASRGTRMHNYLEHYIIHDDMKPLPSNPFAQPSWYMAAQVILEGLHHADEIWGTEVPVYYSGLYAGSTDLVGKWKTKPAIMDFKQSNKVKKIEYISDYFCQLCAYAQAHNNMHGTNIETGVIMMCVKPKTENDTPQYLEFVIEGSDFKYWSEQWNQRVEKYYKLNK